MNSSLPAQVFEDVAASLGPRLAARLRRRYEVAGVLVEDLAQEALLRAWERPQLFQSASQLEAWTYTVACNLLVSERRRLSREERLNRLWLQGQEVEARTPDGGRQEAPRDVLLDECIDRCKDPRRRLIVRKYLAGDKTAAIAAELGTKVNSVLSHLHRFRQQARHELREHVRQEELSFA